MPSLLRFSAMAATLLAVLLVGLAMSQPPGDRTNPPPGKEKGPPPRFELGRIFPPPLREELQLTPEQEKELAALEKELKVKLTKILTDKQKKTIENFRPRGPGGRDPRGLRLLAGPAPEGNTDRRDRLPVDWKEPPLGLVKNPRFTEPPPKVAHRARAPAHYTLTGDVAWVRCGNADEDAERGVALYSGGSSREDPSGLVTQTVTGFPKGAGQWFRFSCRGLAEPGFAVKQDALFLSVGYFGKKGTDPLDGVSRNIYPLVERDRKELAENGKFRKNGGAVWKTYILEFRLPFAEIDTLRLGVGFKNGCGKSRQGSEFYVTEFALTPIPAPEDAPRVVKTTRGGEPHGKTLIPLGGRWYYDPEPGMKERPATLTVTARNAHRLFYRDSRLTNPFAENMSAWLRKGHLDLRGNVVAEDRFLPDNVVVEFRDGKEMVIHTRNIPNHATGRFPGQNPNSIQEQDCTYYLPLEPVRNPRAVAMDRTNSNRALPGGTIGFAINGVAFFNPFDMGGVDATDMMDRCCGHPSPDNRYHYHKYPVCVKSPFVDEGEDHSPLIGWALDGFPIYGPYVARGVMAKDATRNPLDAFNMRHDDERGWHYHVTPGRYPYLIGGFAGVVDPRNIPRRGPPRGPRLLP